MAAWVKSEAGENRGHYEIQMPARKRREGSIRKGQQWTVHRADENTEPRGLGFFVC